MTRIKLNVGEAGCSKPGCKRRWTKVHRHHKGHEWIFVVRWSISHLMMGKAEVRSFVSRYWNFDRRDVVNLCAWHHCEIHLLYDRLIEQDAIRRRKGLDRYTWAEAQELMKKLRKACNIWLKEETPGKEPSLRLGLTGD